MIELQTIINVWVNALAWFAGLSLIFLVLTRFSPCNPGKYWWHDRRAAFTDILYWLLLPLMMQIGRIAFLVLGTWLLYGSNPQPEFIARALPIAVQCILILLIQDVLMYWIHRLFHTRFAWKFHAVHHSPEVLDWTSTMRFHPVNAIAEFALADVIILLMGFSPTALIILGPINMMYSVMVHANLNWTFGPLRYIFASPVFHRWHHTSEEEGRDCNFAPTFPFLDYFWGTFAMPAQQRPQVYGVGDPTFPRGFLGQTVYPFLGIGPWALRHPVIGIALTMGAIFGGYLAYEKLAEPQEIVKNTPTDIPLSQPSEPRQLQFDRAAVLEPASCVSVSATANRIAFGNSLGSTIIRNPSSEERITCDGHNRRVNAIAFSPDGSKLASASGDETARIFDVKTGNILGTLPKHGTSILSIALLDDGRIVTATVDGILRISTMQGQLLKQRATKGGASHAIAASADGKHIVIAQSSSVSVWQPDNNILHEYTGLKQMPYGIAMSANGKQFAVGEYSGRVLMWNVGTFEPSWTQTQHDGPVYTVAFSNNGKVLASGGADKQVRLWNVQDGKLARTLSGLPGMAFAVSLDGNNHCVIAAGKDGQFKVWEPSPGEIIQVGN